MRRIQLVEMLHLVCFIFEFIHHCRNMQIKGSHRVWTGPNLVCGNIDMCREQVNAMMVALMDSVAPNLLKPLRRADLYMRMCVNLCHIYRVSGAAHEPDMLRSVLELLLACNEVIDYRRMHAAVGRHYLTPPHPDIGAGINVVLPVAPFCQTGLMRTTRLKLFGVCSADL